MRLAHRPQPDHAPAHAIRAIRAIRRASKRRDQDEVDTWDFEAHAGGSGHEVRCQLGHLSHLYARTGAFRSFAKCFLRIARKADSARHRVGYTIFEHGHTATCPHVRRAHLAHIQTGTMVSHLKVICRSGCMVPLPSPTLAQTGQLRRRNCVTPAPFCCQPVRRSFFSAGPGSG